MNFRENFYTNSFVFVNYVNLTEVQNLTIWVGRNHPEVRRWMDNPEPFSWESHLKYVEYLKNKDDRSYWAVIYNNLIIGSICLNPIGNIAIFPYCAGINVDTNALCAETGMFLLQEYIGKGYGTSMKKEFVEHILTNTDIEVLFLKTQHDNIRTIKLNQSLGYYVFNEDEVYVYMMKTRL